MVNVLSWENALKEGCEPRLYSYKDTTAGTINAVLDFKIWAKESVAVVCYFTDVETGTKFQLSVFRLKDKTYKLKNSEIDFTTCPSGEEYKLTIEKNSKDNPFLKCILLTESR